MPLRRDLTEDGADFDMPNVVSNGAYHVSAWSKSSKLTAVRNEEYYEARLVGPDELGFVLLPARKRRGSFTRRVTLTISPTCPTV